MAYATIALMANIEINPEASKPSEKQAVYDSVQQQQKDVLLPLPEPAKRSWFEILLKPLGFLSGGFLSAHLALKSDLQKPVFATDKTPQELKEDWLHLDTRSAQHEVERLKQLEAAKQQPFGAKKSVDAATKFMERLIDSPHAKSIKGSTVIKPSLHKGWIDGAAESNDGKAPLTESPKAVPKATPTKIRPPHIIDAENARRIQSLKKNDISGVAYRLGDNGACEVRINIAANKHRSAGEVVLSNVEAPGALKGMLNTDWQDAKDGVDAILGKNGLIAKTLDQRVEWMKKLNPPPVLKSKNMWSAIKNLDTDRQLTVGMIVFVGVVAGGVVADVILATARAAGFVGREDSRQALPVANEAAR